MRAGGSIGERHSCKISQNCEKVAKARRFGLTTDFKVSQEKDFTFSNSGGGLEAAAEK